MSTEGTPKPLIDPGAEEKFANDEHDLALRHAAIDGVKEVVEGDMERQAALEKLIKTTQECIESFRNDQTSHSALHIEDLETKLRAYQHSLEVGEFVSKKNKAELERVLAEFEDLKRSLH